jgi:hypothetical protein
MPLIFVGRGAAPRQAALGLVGALASPTSGEGLVAGQPLSSLSRDDRDLQTPSRGHSPVRVADDRAVAAIPGRIGKVVATRGRATPRCSRPASSSG